ncbi:protein SIEVE ELEMENT OCCLUSION A-like [Euphorbia lathyris]|uniref:protein SIEVE ELEMENT OCCLUSION A-like n=1 Tax=Euphorbia lathyris TaxID=212925 RepID=UPI0033137E62
MAGLVKQAFGVAGKVKQVITTTIDDVLKTHQPDGTQVDVHHLFDILSTIFLPNDADADAVLKQNADTETIWNFFCQKTDGIPAETIRKLSCEMTCNCSGKDAQEKTKEMLKVHLSRYYWDAKIVISLAAFAVNFGEFRLLTQFDNPIAKHVALLKRLQGIIKNPSSYDKLFAGINVLIQATLTLTRCVLQFTKYFGTSNPKLSTSTIQTVSKAAFYAIQSVVICSTHISGLGLETQAQIDVTVTVSTLSTLATQIITFTQDLQKQFDASKQDQEEYTSVVQLFKEKSKNKIAILKALFGDVKSPLVVVRNHITTEVSWEHLESKKVLLFICSYYPGIEKEIKDLADVYIEHQDTIEYQLIWFPINITNENHFTTLKSLMPWCTVRDMSVLRGGAYKYIEKIWKKFQKKPILLPLGIEGLEESHYTIDWLWTTFDLQWTNRGSSPSITDGKQKQPWEELQLNFHYLLGSLYQPRKATQTSNGGVSAPIICLYGGEELKWIQTFTQLVEALNTKLTTITIELVYVSKRDAIDDNNRDIFKFLETKSITYWTAKDTKCRRFWGRLENLFSSAIRNGRNTKQDIMKEVITLLGYNASSKGWTVFGQLDAKLSVKIAKASGGVAELVLKETEKWWTTGSITDFLKKLSIQLDEKAKTEPHHCCHVMLPSTVGDNVHEITCPVCEKDMGNFRFYTCCV